MESTKKVWACAVREAQRVDGWQSPSDGTNYGRGGGGGQNVKQKRRVFLA
jgi:hypothetical protein